VPAKFIDPMLLLRTEKLPEGPEWIVELKLDGYRYLVIKTGGKVHLRSRKDDDFNGRYPGVVKALASNAGRNSNRRRSRGARRRRQAIV
jgi:ATP-dependent DNA ligase